MKRVPKRINDIDICYLWPVRSEPDDELRALIREDQMLMVACPDGCPKLIADFKRKGGIVLLYISTYKAPLIEEVPDNLNIKVWEGGSPDRTSISLNPYWKTVNLTNHPDWILYYPDEQPRRPFEDPNYMAGWYQTNPSSKGYQEAVLKGIQAIVHDERFDGIMYDNFIDWGRPSKILQEGQFKTITADEDRNAFLSLAQLIRETGDRTSQEVGKEHFWIVLNGEHPEIAHQIADVLELESFMYSWAWPGASMNDQEALKKLTTPCTLLKRGGRWMPMPYFGFSGNDIVEDAKRLYKIIKQTNAIFSDMFTLARPAMVSTFARRNWAKQSGGQDKLPDPPALKALRNEVTGNPIVAKEIYGIK